jgi:hypothetical protein
MLVTQLKKIIYTGSLNVTNIFNYIDIFATFSIKIIKKCCETFFLLYYLIKNVFATFFVKTIKTVCEKCFFY